MPVTAGATPTEVNLGNVPAAQPGTRLGVWQASAPYPDPNFPGKYVRDTSVELPNIGGVNPQSGTSYTVQASDQGLLIVFTNASAVAVNVPATLPNYFLCWVLFLGAAGGTVTPSGG